jgi:hypothetical protein
VYLAFSEAKKPIVGHNCTYDLLFLHSHFEVRGLRHIAPSITTQKQ